MVTQKIIEVYTCDRCRKELDADHWHIKMARIMANRELDLCDDCEMAFKAFMMNKPYYEEPETETTTEDVKETVETIDEPVDNERTRTMSSDIDFKRGFPTRLRTYMKNNKLTIAEIAALIGVSHATISNWLRGTYGGINARTQEKLDKFIAEYGL